MSGRYGSDESGTPSRGGGYGRSGGSGSGGYGGNSQSRGGYQSGGGGGAYQAGDRGNRGGGGGRGGGRGGGSGREGDWVCPSPSCGNVNFARRTECNKCGTPSPGGSGNGGYNRGGGGDGAYNRGSGGGNRGGRSDYGGRGDYDRRGTNEGYSQVPPPASGNNYPPPPSYGGMSSYGADPVTTQNGSNSYPPSYGAPPNPYGAGQGGGGGPPSNYNSDHQGGGYGAPAEAVPVKVKQCDENCGDTCDNSRIYISNLPSDVTIEELQELFGGIGMVGRIKQKRGYKDQWPWNIKIYTDDNGKKKGDACLAYEDPSAAHSAGGFYNGYDLRGNTISVSMAEKSAPKPQTSYGHGGGGGRGGYGGGDRRRDNYRDNSGPQRSSYGGQRSRPY